MVGVSGDSLLRSFSSAVAFRAELVDSSHEIAFRLFSGFYEGYPDLIVDVYARTLVLHDYSNLSEAASDKQHRLSMLQGFVCRQLSWLQAVLCKQHCSS